MKEKLATKVMLVESFTKYESPVDWIFYAWICVEEYEIIDDKVASLKRLVPPEIVPAISVKARQLLDDSPGMAGWVEPPLAPNPEDNFFVPREFAEALLRIEEY